MDRLRKNVWLLAGIPAALYSLGTTMAAQLLIRNFYRFLPQDEAFAAIFAQIETAPMHTPVFLALIPAYLCCLFGVSLWRRKVWRIPVVLAGVLLAVVLTAVCIFLTRVNGIRFGDIVLSLLDVLEKGGLDGL